MAKQIMQFRYYAEGNSKNQPRTINKAKLSSGSVFSNYFPITQLGIQALPGTKFYLNNSTTPIIIGSTGIYELDLEGLSDSEVARICDFSKSTLSDWKSGKSIPKADKMVLIARCIKTSVEYLVTGEKPVLDDGEFSVEDIELIKMYQKLKEEQKTAIFTIMRSLALGN